MGELVRLTRVWSPRLVAQCEPSRSVVLGTVVRHDPLCIELKTAEGVIELFALGEFADHVTTVEVADA